MDAGFWLPQANRQKGIANRAAKQQRLRKSRLRSGEQIRLGKIRESSFQNLIRGRLDFTEIHRSSLFHYGRRKTPPPARSGAIGRLRVLNLHALFWVGKFWRRGGDSNPRHPFGVKLISSQPCSATPAPLRGFMGRKCNAGTAVVATKYNTGNTAEPTATGGAGARAAATCGLAPPKEHSLKPRGTAVLLLGSQISISPRR